MGRKMLLFQANVCRAASKTVMYQVNGWSGLFTCMLTSAWKRPSRTGVRYRQGEIVQSAFSFIAWLAHSSASNTQRSEGPQQKIAVKGFKQFTKTLCGGRRLSETQVCRMVQCNNPRTWMWHVGQLSLHWAILMWARSSGLIFPLHSGTTRFYWAPAQVCS